MVKAVSVRDRPGAAEGISGRYGVIYETFLPPTRPSIAGGRKEEPKCTGLLGNTFIRARESLCEEKTL